MKIMTQLQLEMNSLQEHYNLLYKDRESNSREDWHQDR